MRTQGKADETVEGPAHPRAVVSRRATAPGLRPVETQMLRLQQAAGNQAVTGFVHSPTATPEERFAALIHGIRQTVVRDRGRH